jgi:hypothetical protein
MPAFRVDGQVVAGFRATSTGCSYYPFSGRTLATLAAHLTRLVEGTEQAGSHLLHEQRVEVRFRRRSEGR